MHTVISKDGTTIAFARSGKGSPLILVHGTTADHTRWNPLLPQLEAHFTVYAIDRRGRGGSGDAPGYAIEREFDDLAAVADAIGEAALLLGHSYGAVCALEALLRTSNIRKVVLYEPPIRTTGSLYPPGTIERLQALLDVGDRDGVVSTFFREVVRAPEEELRMLRSLPNWGARVAAAHTIPREMRINDEYRFEPARFSAVRVPTLLLLGGSSPPLFKDAVEAVHAALPVARVAALPGQQHTAMNTAPELFLREVLDFFLEPAAPKR
ncbi:MAG TPA: alpha/beta hydrolase [Candidatus Eisenbacteria bacterium]|jgi:pimeloyl-ACP methyl ester carboxylesterase